VNLIHSLKRRRALQNLRRQTLPRVPFPFGEEGEKQVLNFKGRTNDVNEEMWFQMENFPHMNIPRPRKGRNISRDING